MNTKNLTQAELDLIDGFTFKEQPDMSQEEYDTLCFEISKKIYVILLNNTDLTYPPEVLEAIQNTADRINAEALNVKVIDNNNQTEDNMTIK